ncbi:unnamed protein product [Schistosoma curassoni]|uniref:Uncharacterized protein n=1 Tax=Schistosoma curassoni TaxID=6186 RepID=A0A183JLX4_9TREM|nr:unnamed protein product [Schistosoma curassoni]
MKDQFSTKKPGPNLAELLVIAPGLPNGTGSRDFITKSKTVQKLYYQSHEQKLVRGIPSVTLLAYQSHTRL